MCKAVARLGSRSRCRRSSRRPAGRRLVRPEVVDLATVLVEIGRSSVSLIANMALKRRVARHAAACTPSSSHPAGLRLSRLQSECSRTARLCWAVRCEHSGLARKIARDQFWRADSHRTSVHVETLRCMLDAAATERTTGSQVTASIHRWQAPCRCPVTATVISLPDQLRTFAKAPPRHAV